MEWYIYVIVGIVIALIIFQLIIRFVFQGQIEEMICDFYKERELVVIDFLDFTSIEKLRLGIPRNFIHEMMLGLFSIFFLFGANHFRKVITEDKVGDKQERCIELFVRNRKVKRVKELGVLDI